MFAPQLPPPLVATAAEGVSRPARRVVRLIKQRGYKRKDFYASYDDAARLRKQREGAVSGTKSWSMGWRSNKIAPGPDQPPI